MVIASDQYLNELERLKRFIGAPERNEALRIILLDLKEKGSRTHTPASEAGRTALALINEYRRKPTTG
jgi:hypothetical protein